MIKGVDGGCRRPRTAARASATSLVHSLSPALACRAGVMCKGVRNLGLIKLNVEGFELDLVPAAPLARVS